MSRCSRIRSAVSLLREAPQELPLVALNDHGSLSRIGCRRCDYQRAALGIIEKQAAAFFIADEPPDHLFIMIADDDRAVALRRGDQTGADLFIAISGKDAVAMDSVVPGGDDRRAFLAVQGQIAD